MAVAARSLSRAQGFIKDVLKEDPLAKAYGSYDELIADPVRPENIFSLSPMKLTCMHLLLRRQDVDCVYIGTTNPEHFEPAKKALEAGKVSSLPVGSSRCSGRG